MNSHLERLARRILRDPFFLAAPLTRYAESHQLDDAALAAQLGCDMDTLTHLRLCRNPELLSPNFWQDIQRIADRFQIDPDRLAEIVRFGQALLQPAVPPDAPAEQVPGFLMAARDEEPPEPEGTGKT